MRRTPFVFPPPPIFPSSDKMNEPSGLATAFLRSQTSKDEDKSQTEQKPLKGCVLDDVTEQLNHSQKLPPKTAHMGRISLYCFSIFYNAKTSLVCCCLQLNMFLADGGSPEGMLNLRPEGSTMRRARQGEKWSM